MYTYTMYTLQLQLIENVLLDYVVTLWDFAVKYI